MIFYYVVLMQGTYGPAMHFNRLEPTGCFPSFYYVGNIASFKSNKLVT